MATKTIKAIKNQYRSLSAYAKLHEFNVSQMNDMLHKRGTYGEPNYVPNKGTNAYAILQSLAKNGFKDLLQEEGWNFDNIDLNAPIVVHKRQSTMISVESSAVVSLEDIVNALCDIGDDYTCSVFKAVSEGGPIAVLFMMERCSSITKTAGDFLTKRFPSLKFSVESDDVIAIWND